MKYFLLAIGLITLLCQCKRANTPPDPKIAALIGTWQLTTPDSSAGTTITFSLDMNNPPQDITAFDVRGQGLQNVYSGRMYATIDGTMQLQQITATAQSSPVASQKADQLYLTRLQSVARYEQPTGELLRLYFGKPTTGSLIYKKY